MTIEIINKKNVKIKNDEVNQYITNETINKQEN